jgi:hypothetical protein
MSISWGSNPPYPESFWGGGDWPDVDEVMGAFLIVDYLTREPGLFST